MSGQVWKSCVGSDDELGVESGVKLESCVESS